MHLPARSEAELRRLVITLQALPAVRSAWANPLTGNVLVRFDERAMDTATLEALIRASGRTPAASRPGVVTRERRWEKQVALRRRSRPTSRGRTRPTTATPSPRPTRVLWPLIHLLFCASPLGLALHVGEVCWAVWPFVIRRGTRAPGVPVSPVVGDNGRAARDRRWSIAS